MGVTISSRVSGRSDDPNHALLNWDAHQNHVLKSSGYDDAHKLIFDRLTDLGKSMSKDNYARLNVDCSVLLVNYLRMK